MQPETSSTDSDRRTSFIDSLGAFGRQHRAQHWEGTFGDFLATILPGNPGVYTRAIISMAAAAASISSAPKKFWST